ncbi:MAG: tetratricopeptide repeat protein [Phycisphaerae bacterium]
MIQAYRYSEALSVAQRKEEGQAESSSLERLLGIIHDRLDDREQAELHFRAALQINRDDREAQLALAHLLLSGQQNNRAKLHLRTLLDRDPRFDEARELLASVYSNELKLDAAIAQLQELRRLTNQPLVRARCDALLTLRRNGDLDAYREALRTAIEKHGEDATTWIALGDSYTEAQDEKATDAFEHALAVDPQNEDAFERLRAAYGRLLMFERAADLQERFLPRRPNRHAWRFQLLQLWQLTLQTNRALTLARNEMARADISDRIRNRYRNTVLTILRRTGRTQEALRMLTKWHADHPDDIATAAELSAFFLRQKQPAKAVSLLRELHEQHPDNRQVHETLIDTLVVAERHDRAAQLALELLEKDPGNGQTIGLLASILAENDRTTDALELIENQLLHTENREFFQNLANRVLVGGKHYDRAIEQTERLLDGVDRVVGNITQPGAGRGDEAASPTEAIWFPDRPFSLNRLEERLDELRVQLVSVQIAAGRYQAAREHILTWLESSPNQRFAFVMLLQLRACQTMLGEDDAAAETTERALMIENDNVGLNNDVAYGWIDQGIRLDEAEPRIRFAVARNPGQGAYLDTFGWLMYKKGEFQEAKKWLLRARAFQQSGDAVIFDHLGDACWRLGQAQEATEHWKAALEKLKETEDDALSPDEKRVRDVTPGKIEAARAGKEPEVAELAQPAKAE